MKKWYFANLGKIVLLSLVIVLFTVTVSYVPYFNLLLRWSGILVSIITFYLLFPQSTKTLVILSMVVLFFAFLCTLVKLDSLVEASGSLLMLILIFIAINYGKGFFGKEVR